MTFWDYPFLKVQGVAVEAAPTVAKYSLRGRGLAEWAIAKLENPVGNCDAIDLECLEKTTPPDALRRAN